MADKFLFPPSQPGRVLVKGAAATGVANDEVVLSHNTTTKEFEITIGTAGLTLNLPQAWRILEIIPKSGSVLLEKIVASTDILILTVPVATPFKGEVVIGANEDLKFTAPAEFSMLIQVVQSPNAVGYN